MGMKVNNIYNYVFVICLYIYVLNIIGNSLKAVYYAIPIVFLLAITLLLLSFFGKKIVKFISILLIFLASVAIFYKWRYKIKITEDIILSGLLDDISLTKEILSVNLFFWVLITAIVPIFLIIKSNIVMGSAKKRIASIIILFFLALLLMYIQGYKYRHRGQIRDYKLQKAINFFSPLDFLFSTQRAFKSYKKLFKQYNTETFNDPRNYYTNDNNESIIVVLVLGESSRGDHFSLNGYTRKTNPKLESLNNIYSFKNVSSCDTITYRSIKYIFTNKNCKYSQEKYKNSFVNTLNFLGFDTQIISLQNYSAYYKFLGYNKIVTKSTIIANTEKDIKDFSLLPYFEKAIKSSKNSIFITLHTLGSHQNYNDRYDLEHMIFKPVCKTNDYKSCTREELINSYDNTIIYIDDFLYQVINYLKNKNAILFYISDHGESLGENGYYFHGIDAKQAPKEQFNIPFIIWGSKKFMDSDMGKTFKNKIRNVTNISHDNLFYSILGCSGIKPKEKNSNFYKLSLCPIQ
jgi:KDO II ethanolaminephosphotransferase